MAARGQGRRRRPCGGGPRPFPASLPGARPGNGLPSLAATARRRVPQRGAACRPIAAPPRRPRSVQIPIEIARISTTWPVWHQRAGHLSVGRPQTAPATTIQPAAATACGPFRRLHCGQVRQLPHSISLWSDNVKPCTAATAACAPSISGDTNSSTSPHCRQCKWS